MAGQRQLDSSKWRILLPFAMGALIDMADVLTFGPVGLRFGLLIGGILGWVLAKVLGFPPRYRWIAIALSGIYCALPGTAVFPLGTTLAVLSQLLGWRAAEEPAPPDDGDGGPGRDRPGDTGDGPVIEAEYRSKVELDSD